MKQTLRILFLLLLAFVLATTVFAQETIAVGDSVDGEADGEVVEYEIELEEGATIEISLESGDFDTLVRILDADGEELDSDDDGGGDRNSLLEFTAEAGGTYIIVVDAYDHDNFEGEYELSIDGDSGSGDDSSSSNGSSAATGDADLVYNEDMDFDVDGEDVLEVTFNGANGDVVTILTRSEAEQDLRIFLTDPNGEEIETNSEYNFGNAFLIRVPLDTDGLYTIRLEEVEGEELEDDIEIEIQETELLDLGVGAQTAVIDAAVGEDYMFLEAEDGVVYEFTVNLDDDISSTLEIELYQEGDTFSSSATASYRDIEQASFLFEASEDGIIIVQLDYWGFDSEIEVTIEVAAQ